MESDFNYPAGWTTTNSGQIPDRGIWLSVENIHTSSGDQASLYSMCIAARFLVANSWGVNLTTHLYLVIRLCVTGLVCPLPLRLHDMHRSNFTFTVPTRKKQREGERDPPFRSLSLHRLFSPYYKMYFLFTFKTVQQCCRWWWYEQTILSHPNLAHWSLTITSM
jgi:hypothetical protein